MLLKWFNSVYMPDIIGVHVSYHISYVLGVGMFFHRIHQMYQCLAAGFSLEYVGHIESKTACSSSPAFSLIIDLKTG